LEGEQEKLTFEDFDAAYTFIMGRYQDRDPFTVQTGMITEEQY
jgi:hypothetical protein